MIEMNTTGDTIRYYHNITKHTLRRYAAAPEALDWDDQPEAFRWFDGAPKTDLPLIADRLGTLYIDLYQTGKGEPRPLTLDNIGGLLELSFGIAAWKQYGDARWALRCNPSSGNLHAEEAYVICNDVKGLAAGVHHYLSRDHQLEQRCHCAEAALPADTLLIGISSIQWREMWKYGERAYRYCQLDTGHAIATLRYAAATLGWKVKMLDQISDQQLATLLGLERAEDFGTAEAERPALLLQVGAMNEVAEVDIETLITSISGGAWQGRANTLSQRHMYEWPIIETVNAAAEKPVTHTITAAHHDFPTPLPSPCILEATLLIRRRRSAQAFDGRTVIGSEAFYRMLDMTLPRQDTPPWDCTPWNDNVNLILFVHRVKGLKPGLYALVRNSDTFDSFKTAVSREQFQWQDVDGCPSHLPLYTLVNANGRNLAATLACHQGIAGQSCFSLAMIADCGSMAKDGWQYRTLYWEAGMIGQVLYLEAEAAAIQGTGIGCYFDDAVHEILGIQGERWQDFYHFTVGKGIHDGRIQTIAPYAHLAKTPD